MPKKKPSNFTCTFDRVGTLSRLVSIFPLHSSDIADGYKLILIKQYSKSLPQLQSRKGYMYCKTAKQSVNLDIYDFAFTVLVYAANDMNGSKFIRTSTKIVSFGDAEFSKRCPRRCIHTPPTTAELSLINLTPSLF